MMKPLQGWNKGCHGEVKCFTGIKSSCSKPAQPWELAATEASAGELWDKEWLRAVLAQGLGSCLPHALL